MSKYVIIKTSSIKYEIDNITGVVAIVNNLIKLHDTSSISVIVKGKITIGIKGCLNEI